MRYLTMPWMILLLGLDCGSAAAIEIYRCEDRNGQRVLTDQPCRSIGALSLPSERDQPPSAASVPEPTGTADEQDPDIPLAPPAAAAGCPGPTPEALGRALVEAAARKDLNSLAGLYHWPAAGRGASGRVFAAARRMSAAAPLSFELIPARADDSWLWAGEAPPEAPRLLPTELLVGASADAGSLIARFPLIAHAGCYWLPP